MLPQAHSFSLSLAGGHSVSLQKPGIMGVINASPDSFYRPYHSEDEIFAVVERMVTHGVDIIDIGGEATNPAIDLNNGPPSIEEQIYRVVPLIEHIAKRFDVLISVDTSDPGVMREAVKSGAHLINDQRGLSRAGALETVVELNVPVCLMHFFDSPRIPGSSSPTDLLALIKADLEKAAARCRAAGLSGDKMIIDPGFGQGNYGKNADENYYLLAHLQEFTTIGLPVLAGWSRKSMIRDALDGAVPEDRLYGSIAAATIAAMQGAALLRVHDVAETRDAIKIFRAMRDAIN